MFGGGFMIRASDLTEKEVVNVMDGKKLGFICDIDVDLRKGRINAIIVPNDERIFGLFGKDYDYAIPWSWIKKIGTDVILVEIKGNMELNKVSYLKERNNIKQFSSPYEDEDINLYEYDKK